MDQWPLAARHAAERRLRSQLRGVGWPTGDLLPFGSTAFPMGKWWQNQYEPWRQVREEVVVLGPAKFSSLTSTSYYVISKETGKWFYTDDVIIPEPEQPEEDAPVIYLPERPPDEEVLAAPNIPTHRVRGKQAPAMISRRMRRESPEDGSPGQTISPGRESSWTFDRLTLL